jgi:hypothetical protein
MFSLHQFWKVENKKCYDLFRTFLLLTGKFQRKKTIEYFLTMAVADFFVVNIQGKAFLECLHELL